MKAIFLDIDGVLNNRRTRTKTPERCTGISEPLLKRLGRIVESTMETSDDKTEIVLTSSWKYLDSAEADYKYMCSKLKKAGIESIEVTRDPGGNSLNRGQGIIDYISENPEISQYVILDDYIFDMQDDLVRHLVLTEGSHGLTDSDVEVAVGILKGVLLPSGYYNGIADERGYYR